MDTNSIGGNPGGYARSTTWATAIAGALVLLGVSTAPVAEGLNAPPTSAAHDHAAATIRIDPDELRDAALSGQPFELSLPDETLQLHLQPVTLLKGQARLTTADAILYKGTIVEWDGGQARLSEDSDGIRGTLRGGELTIALEPIKETTDRTDHRLVDLISQGSHSCGDEPQVMAGEVDPTGGGAAPPPPPPTAFMGPLLELELAVLADVQFFEQYGANAEATIQGYVNQVNGIYEPQIGVTVVISDLIVWSAEPDPYSTPGITGLLTDTAAYLNSTGLDSDAIAMISGRSPGATAGLSGVGTVCYTGTNNFACYEYGNLTYILLAHELGHTLGAPHDQNAPGSLMAPIMNTNSTVLSAASVDIIEETLIQSPCLAVQAGTEPSFIRGDANSSGAINVSDAIFLLGNLFAGGAPLECAIAADVNDSGSVNINDAIRLLGLIFAGEPPLSSPYPVCGSVSAATNILTCGNSSCP